MAGRELPTVRDIGLTLMNNRFDTGLNLESSSTDREKNINRTLYYNALKAEERFNRSPEQKKKRRSISAEKRLQSQRLELETGIGPDDEVEVLRRKVLQAAAGKPLERSISDEKTKEQVAHSLIRRLLLLKLDGFNAEGSEQTSDGDSQKSDKKKPKKSSGDEDGE